MARKRRRSARRSNSRRRRSSRASRGGLALPEILIGAGAGIGLGGLTHTALNAVNIQLPPAVKPFAAALGPAALWALGQVTKSQLAKRLVMPSLIGAAAIYALQQFGPGGSGAYRLRGSGAAAARATLKALAPDQRMRYIAGTGASAAAATLAG